MKLITISGVDGSGKSTQRELLTQTLERQDRRVFYFHAVEFSLANRLSRLLKGDKTFTPGSEKAAIKASWFTLQLRKFFLLIDIYRFKSLMKKLQKQGCDYILSDRYFYDSVINILYLSKSASTLWLERFIPHPDHAFYLQITTDTIMQRERVPEQGIDYLKNKLALFEQRKEAFGMIFVDAAQDKSRINQVIEEESFR